MGRVSVSSKIPGEVYALSVEQGYQSGEIYRIGGCLVVQHYCGFVFLRGDVGGRDLNELYERVQSSRRAILFSSDKVISDFCRSIENVNCGRRIFFEYRAGEIALPALPEGAVVRSIDAVDLERIKGHITPDFSWEDRASFLSNGIGYCITFGDDIAAWAFSAGISDSEIDIGVETAEEYRGRGLSPIVASYMVDHILRLGKVPVWACDAANNASKKVALKVGFEIVGECDRFVLKG